ncbi:DUF3024 domain-containing protein [Persicobacter diffluens]|uniref:DUF3024 domain-containing protein n=1 Tax=Persicobacter diffluens TaxID=981 RepID=A0AAN5AL73_9BACT|nr:hypothetical protein PEDI_41620 [Persicobacter diffluens]
MSENSRVVSIFEKSIASFVEAMRPAEDMRDEVDIGYTFEKNTLILLEIRPSYVKPGIIVKSPIAKAKFIKSRSIWKLYWCRADESWDPYQPNPELENLTDVFEIINEDEYGCFWG